MDTQTATGDSRGHAVLAATISVIIISSIFVILRMITRVSIVRRFAWDDIFMVIAWVIAFGLSVSICYGTSRGLGHRDVAIKPGWFKPLKKSEYVFSVLYNPALMATKTSILLFYLSLSKTERLFRGLSIATLVLVNVNGIALTILNIFQCNPVRAVFDRISRGDAKCGLDIIGLYLGSAPVNIITDLAILFLPMPILTGMRMPKKQKTILVFTFALGGFVAVVDVVRIYYLQTASLERLQQIGKEKTSSDQVDYSYYASLSFMWSVVEVNVGIICACIPTLKPLVTRVLPSLLRDRDGTMRSSGPLDSPLHDSIREKTAASNGSAFTGQDIPNGSSTSSKTCGNNAEMDFKDFLATPDARQSNFSQAITANEPARDASIASGFYDFVDLSKRKSMVKMTTREALLPLTFVTVLFFLWGFAYGLMDVLNAQFQAIIQLSEGQSNALHGIYFAGYLVAPLTFGRIIFEKLGFKATFIAGLWIYACGTLVFWPSAVLTSYPAFLISNFIVGMGLATLETAANPFIALCGPPQYAELRLNVSQAFQAIATVVSPLLAKHVLFRTVLDAPSLVDVQWTYLGIALFVVLLAVAFYYIPLPEASNDDLEDIRSARQDINDRKVGPFAVIYVTLGLAVFSQFCYVSAQEGVSTGLNRYLVAIGASTNLSSSDWQAVAHTLFAVGRFLGAILNIFVTPRFLILGFYMASVLTSALAFQLSHQGGLAVFLLVFLFEASLFPTIFAIAMRGLGRHTKSGSAYITAAISGGAVAPAIAMTVADSRGAQYAMCIALSFFAAGSIFPIYLCAVPAAKRQVDDVALSLRKGSRRKRALSAARREKQKSEEGTSEHIEKSAVQLPSV